MCLGWPAVKAADLAPGPHCPLCDLGDPGPGQPHGHRDAADIRLSGRGRRSRGQERHQTQEEEEATHIPAGKKIGREGESDF